jgi:hypothetical protein
MDSEESHSSSKWWIIKLHIQISELHMCVVPGPASQDAVFKCLAGFTVYTPPSCVAMYIM